MLSIASTNDQVTGSPEATTVIGGIIVILVILIIVFLFVFGKNCSDFRNFKKLDGNIVQVRRFRKRIHRHFFSMSNFDCDEDIFRKIHIEPIPHHIGDTTNYLDKHSLKKLQTVDGIKKETLDDIQDTGGFDLQPNYSIPANAKNRYRSESFDLEECCERVYSSKTHESKVDDRITISVDPDGTNHRADFTFKESYLDDPIREKNEECILFLPDGPNFECPRKMMTEKETDLSDLSTQSAVGAFVEISLLYDAPLRKMTVHVLQAKGIPARSSGQHRHTQIRLIMLPSKKQKHKTKIRSGENPQFLESFVLHRVKPEEVNSMGLRLRVYGCERMRKERLIGEAVVSFAHVDLELETNLWLPLESQNDLHADSMSDVLSLTRSDSVGSTKSEQRGGVPEILLGLSYNGTTGRLIVEVVKGSHLRGFVFHKPPDTYVKLHLVNSIGQEMARAKTSIRRGQSNPLFKEAFAFQVTLFQLNDVTLMVSVYAKRNMKRNEMVGWFSLGLSSTGAEELAHWIDMREKNKGGLLNRWHVLLDSEFSSIQ